MRTSITLYLLFIHFGLHAQSYLDATWGNAGVVYQQEQQFAIAHETLPMADGRVLVCGNTPGSGNTLAFVSRYHSDGSLDPTWGDNGIAHFAIGSTGTSFHSIGLQGSASGGRIVVSGSAYFDTDALALFIGLTSTGDLDPTFGDAGIQLYSPSGMRTFLNDMSIDDAGSIYATGEAYDTDELITDLFAMRLTADGQPDATFNGTGYSTALITGIPCCQYWERCALAPDGSLVIAGVTHAVGDIGHLTVHHVLTNGLFDPDFGNASGVYIYPSTSRSGDVTVLSDGTIVVAGSQSGPTFFDPMLVALDATGMPAPVLNGSAVAEFPLDGTLIPEIGGLVVTDGGAFVFGGVLYGAGSEEGRFFLMRTDAQGVLDVGFGDAGTLIEPTVYPGTYEIYRRRLSQDGLGRLYQSGTDMLTEDAIVVRYADISTDVADTDRAQDRLILSPVPTSHMITINGIGNTSARLAIIDGTGRPVRTQRSDEGGSITLDVSTLATGAYVLRVEDEHGARHARFVVQR